MEEEVSILKDIEEKEFELESLTLKSTTASTVQIDDPEMTHYDLIAEVRTLAAIKD